MESTTMGNHEDLPTNSIEEDDAQDRNIGPGGRSYECIFCKRGFTTAQALGGHMNIHRKDRSKSRPNLLSDNNSNKQEDNSYAYPRSYHPVFTSFPQTYISNTSNHHHHHTTYLSSTSSSSQPINRENDHRDAHGVVAGASREDKTMTLGLQFGWSREDNKETKRRIRSGSEEDELDLELRLGHDP